jgi:hypothetical protein
MYNVTIKSAVLLSILTLLPLVSASADRKRAPLILMDTGRFSFTSSTTANLAGTGVSTHLGEIVSTGVFTNVVNRPSGGFKGRIEGEATAVALNATATATPSAADTIEYRLSAEFLPDASGIFYGIGTYVITGGTGKFRRARGFGEFIGLANFGGGTYNCFLRGTISY